MRCIIGQLTGNFLCGNKLRTVLLLVPFTENTVDGRNPAPHWMVETLSIMGCLPPINWWFGFRDHPPYVEFVRIHNFKTGCMLWHFVACCHVPNSRMSRNLHYIGPEGNHYTWKRMIYFFDFNLNIFVPVICGRVVCVHFAVDAFNAGIYSDRFDCIGIG